VSDRTDIPAPLALVLGKLKGVEKTGTLQYQARCPTHEDRKPSLSVSFSNGQVLLYDQAGCHSDTVLDGLGLTYKNLRERAHVVATYLYENSSGETVYRVQRFEPKDFRQAQVDPRRPGRFLSHMRGTTAVPFKLPELLAGLDRGDTVYIVEGEKDVLAGYALDQVGVVFTSAHGGAGKWSEAHAEHLVDAKSRVVIVADKDAAGYKGAVSTYNALLAVADVRAEFATAATGKDLADHLEDHELDELVPMTIAEVRTGADRRSVKSTSAGTTTSPTTGTRVVEVDDGPLAERVGEMLGGRYARVPGLGWLNDTGSVWDSITEDAFVDQVRLVLKRLAVEMVENGMSAGRANDPRILFRVSKIRAVAGLLRGILEVPAEKFDTAADHLNTPNGIVDLRTGTLHPHSPDMRFTRITAAEFHPGARSDDWNSALEAMWPDAVQWMQVRLGQGITGHMPSDDRLVISKGGGANGKSTFFDAIKDALGNFAGPVPEKVLLANPGDHSTELTTLRGLRLAVLEELPEGARFSIKRLKDTVGTAQLTARKIGQDNVTWNATHSLFLTTNYNPKIVETDDGTWRRLVLVKFPYTFVRSNARRLRRGLRRGDPTLRERLRREPQEAVLAWLVEGARRWYENERVMPADPESVTRDTLDWRKETDLVLGFAAEAFEFDPAGVVLASDVFEQFETWLDQNNHTRWSKQTFAARFNEHSYIRDKRVSKVRKRIDKLTVSRPPMGTGPRVKLPSSESMVTGNLHVYTGLVWAETEDEPEEPEE
jgi:putative DNA primase/helicase